MTLALRCLAKEVTAFDLSDAGVAIARQRNGSVEGVNFLVADGTDPKANRDVAQGRYDLIYIREFHPFTRKFFSSAKEAGEVHRKVLAEYVDLLAPGGLIFIRHGQGHDQCIRPANMKFPRGVELVINGLDPRLLTRFLFMTNNRMKWSIFLTRVAQLVLRLRLWSVKNVMYVLQKIQ
ncbi:MAG: methyltransferase domain-containing protein [Elusimicrobia bacterium]|nr:methyltransferase domain-containing protein [Elusimicrobiota bacterium]